jgi:hypothetical protein
MTLGDRCDRCRRPVRGGRGGAEGLPWRDAGSSSGRRGCGRCLRRARNPGPARTAGTGPHRRVRRPAPVPSGGGACVYPCPHLYGRPGWGRLRGGHASDGSLRGLGWAGVLWFAWLRWVSGLWVGRESLGVCLVAVGFGAAGCGGWSRSAPAPLWGVAVAVPKRRGLPGRSGDRPGIGASAATGNVRPVATSGTPSRRTGRKPKYVQYEGFRPARREHAPDAAP